MTYVELHAHSAYSFLDGASSPDELAAQAARYNYPAFALTDHNTLSGSLEFAHSCKSFGFRAITGTELTVSLASGKTAHLTLLVKSRTGYGNLCRLLTEAYLETRTNPTREALPPVVPLERVEQYREGLVCLSGCAGEGVLASQWQDPTAAEQTAQWLASVFGNERFFIELQRPFWRHDRSRNRWLVELASRVGLKCVATGNVHAHSRRRAPLQDALTAVRLHSTLDQSEPFRRGNFSSVLAAPAEMAKRFCDHPEAVDQTELLAQELQFDLTRDLGYRYPGAEDPTADRRLAELCRTHHAERYRKSKLAKEAEARLEEELAIIRQLGLSGFFLLHHDLLELAREVALGVRGPDTARSLMPPGRGRGSSVSSIVCYLTGLSHIDPVEKELFLGRFLNEDITSLPDIDLDFPRDIRKDLIERAHSRYGPERSALVAAFPTYRWRGAIRDLGKVLGLPIGEIEQAARSGHSHENLGSQMKAALGPRSGSKRWQALKHLAQEAYGLPRHISQHSGGMIISTTPLVELCPLQPTAMEGRRIVQWDKDSCADAGFLKIDLLGLGMLSAVERCVDEIAKLHGEQIDLSRIDYGDRKVYKAIQAAETTGVFQIESRAQMQMLPRTQPGNLDDLTVQVALVRPGPIQGGAVHPYIQRRKRLLQDPSYKIPYEHPKLEGPLKDTLGAIVFQDQVLGVAIALAGFTYGEAEGLRRAMSRKRSKEALLVHRDRFIEGAVANGVSRALAESVFKKIEGFSGFGFPKAHAAAFGLLAYQSTWLRVYYGAEFLSALLNEQPMGFYPPDALIHEAQRRGIEVLPPSVNKSMVDCTATKEGAVQIGLGYILGARAEEMQRVVDERQAGGSYSGLKDLANRSGASRKTLEKLVWAGTCEELPRREGLWQLGTAQLPEQTAEGLQLALPFELPGSPKLKDLSQWQEMVADYGSTRVSARRHPFELLRPTLPKELVASHKLKQAQDGSRVEVAGMVVARQRPSTAKGVTFILLEDEFGTINLIAPPPIYERHRLLVRAEPFLIAEGKLEKREGNINLLVRRLKAIASPDLPLAEVEQLEATKPAPLKREETSSEPQEQSQGDLINLRAALPPPHSFGRRAG